MKKNIFLIAIVFLISCNSNTKNSDRYNSTNSESNNSASRNLCGESPMREALPIDSAEFVNFWILFRRAIVSGDTPLLSTLTKDELLGMGIESPSLSSLSELYKNGFPLTFHEGKVSKNEFLKKINEIFIPQFMELLKRYDLNNDLYNNGQPYFCVDRVKNKEYYINAEYDYRTNVISLKLDFSGVDEDSSTGVEFLFSKGKDKKIKLFAVSCYTLSFSV
ncbi:MAG: hypothetical protein H6Q14_2234 [Bacteroidetes bacterium]|jgi:hypothetical protein|nr:hypothetical protein [Bacteroidota bacterium]